MNLKIGVDELINITKKHRDKYQAHEAIQDTLKSLSGEPAVIHEIIKKNLSLSSFRNNKTSRFASVEFNIHSEAEFGFVANCFLPKPKEVESVSSYCIHHHDDVLLSSITSWGPGYESRKLKENFSVDHHSKEAKLEIAEIFTHATNSITFIDRWTPHVVFLPDALSVTYAYWTHTDLQSLKLKALRLKKTDALSRPLAYMRQFLYHRKQRIKQRGYWYTIQEGKLYGIKRPPFKEGTNHSFLQNVFYIMDQTNFRDEAFLNQLDQQANAENHPALKHWVTKYLSNEEIKPAILAEDIQDELIYLSKKDIIRAID